MKKQTKTKEYNLRKTKQKNCLTCYAKCPVKLERDILYSASIATLVCDAWKGPK